MDFFDHQEKARRNTHVLILYFALAVAGIVVAIYSVVVVGLFLAGETPDLDFVQPGTFSIAALATLVVVFLASSFKTMQLAGGGKVVAEELGGRLVDPSTTDFHERRLVNVVEEMAIASGVPVPAIYVMDGESSINAFAAGKTTSDAVIGVTRGCMQLLTRDELQGVIAHEFSHILNGDMRLNMRLMGLLFGILFLALLGEVILRSMAYSGRSSRSREGGGILIAILLAGLALLVIGYAGSFFAKLIKASVSRQREFLADASAVQFTRNPEGIGGALKKIGGLAEGSTVTHPMAGDASHLFFGSAFRSSLFATHPPLRDRIKRVLPDWDGDFSPSELPSITESPSTSRPSAPPAPPLPGIPGSALLAGDDATRSLSEDQALESMRGVHPEQVDLAREIHAHIPEAWIDAAHRTSGAQALVFALLLAQDETLRSEELERLRRRTDAETFSVVSAFHGEVRDLHSVIKLGLVDLCLPSLRRLSPAEYDRFETLLHELIASDRQVDLFEFALQRLVNRHLDTAFRRRRPPRIRFRRMEDLRDEASILLSTMAALSHVDESGVKAAFARGAGHIEGRAGVALAFRPAGDCSLAAIGEAVDRFAEASPPIQRLLLEGCGKSITTDGVITSNEAELVRAIADTMGCSLPPFVHATPLA